MALLLIAIILIIYFTFEFLPDIIDKQVQIHSDKLEKEILEFFKKGKENLKQNN